MEAKCYFKLLFTPNILLRSTMGWGSIPQLPTNNARSCKRVIKKSKQMEEIKTWLEKNYGDQFTITERDKGLELDPNSESLSGCYLKQICKAVEVFGKSMLVNAELKRGIYIMIW